MRLVHGHRRLLSCQRLGQKVLARVVEVADVLAAEVEEDRCREGLSPYAMYRVTEALRPRLTDEAWRRKCMGTKESSLAARGRVDDALADYVGISRGSLKKIRAVAGAWETDNAKYDSVMKALQSDGKIDRHYKRFLEMEKPKRSGAALKAIVVNPDWQSLVTAFRDLCVLVGFGKERGIPDLLADDGILMMPTTIPLALTALELIRRLKCTPRLTVPGRCPEEAIWIVAVANRETELSPKRKAAIEDACDLGFDDVSQFVEKTFGKLGRTLTLKSEAAS